MNVFNTMLTSGISLDMEGDCALSAFSASCQMTLKQHEHQNGGSKMEETREEQGKKYAKLIAKVWNDESFKERLLSDSRTVLEAEGITVPPGVEVKVVEQTDSQIYMIIPIKPASAQMELIQERTTAQFEPWPCI